MIGKLLTRSHQIVDSKSHEYSPLFALPIRCLAEQLGCPQRVALNTGRTLLASLNSRGGQFDESLDKVADDPAASASVPEALPYFVRFPIVTVVVQVDAEQVIAAILPHIGIGRRRRIMFAAVRMARRITGWMREVTGYVRVGWKRQVRYESR